jgi:NifU-like protein
MLEQAIETAPLPPSIPPSDRNAVIAAVIAEMRPVLQRDGGDIQLIRIEDDMVVVDMKGSCIGCVLASVTVAGLRKKIIDAVGRPLRVVPLSATTIRRGQ